MKSFTKSELDAFLAVTEKESSRDALMFRVTFNHGFRVSETLSLTRHNIVDGYVVMQRLKKSRKTTQPLLADERDGLLALAASTEYRLFPMDRSTYGRKMKYYGAKAGIPAFKCHPHALKHSTGRLGYKGGMGLPELQNYLGHKNGGNTMVYLEASEEESCVAFAAAVGK
jgi:integrase